MKPFIRDTLERLRLRLHELDAQLSAPDATADLERFRALTREHAETDAIVQPYLRYLQREAQRREAEQLATEAAASGDEALAAMAADEVAAAQAELANGSKPSCTPCCCRATPTTSATPSSRSAPARAARKPRCLRRNWRACISATPSGKAGAPRSSANRPASWAAPRKWCCASSARVRTGDCASNQAATGCSGYR
jgi:hypothetical protein